VLPASHSAASAWGPVQLPGVIQFHVHPGEVIQGTLVLTAFPKNELVITPRGIELYLHSVATSMILTREGGEDGYEQNAHGGGELFRQDVSTIPVGVEHKFPPGSVTRFPFSFQLPPPSPQTPHTLSHHFPDIDAQPPERDVRFWEVEEDPEEQEGRSYTEAAVAVRYEIKAQAHVGGLFTRNLAAQVDLIVDPVFLHGPSPANFVAPFSMDNTLLIPDY
jgi:hypothetical protein